MNNSNSVLKITGIVNKGVSAAIIEALASNGIVDGHLAVGRADMLFEKKGLFGAGERSLITEDPIDILSFLVTPECENSALNIIIKKGGLDIPGRGMVYSEKVTLLKSHELISENKTKECAQQTEFPLLTDLMGVCCIVQRGQGNTVARVALDTGTCVPAITFGDGTGVRDKLGLLRITIPAEKDVVNFVAGSHDMDTIMDLMIDAGKLDQPGKGFIYVYPIEKGLVNTKITLGMPKHAASIEQIISIIDEIKGGTSWRRRSGTGVGDAKSHRAFLTNLMEFSLICNEGRGMDLVKAAMAAGAAGATISMQKHFCPEDSPLAKISVAREVCNMIVGESQIPAIMEAIGNAGAFDDKSFGMVLTRPAPKACTYLGK